MPGGTPTPQDIALPQISGPRPVAGYDVSGYAQGAEALARSGQQLGAGIEKAGSELFQDQLYADRNDLLLRQRQANADAHQYIASVRNDPSVTPDQVGEQLDSIRQKYAPPGAGPRSEHYHATTAGVFAETADQFGQYYHNRQANEKRADFADRINQLQNTTTWNESPLHTNDMRLLGTEIELAKQHGDLLPTEAERYMRTLVQGVYYERYRKGLADPQTRPAARAELEEANTAGLKAHEGILPTGFVDPLAPAASGGAAPAPGRGAAVAPAIAAWRNAGMPDQAIAGVLHNIKEESGFDPTLRHPDQPNWGGEAHFAHGLYQEGGAEWNHYQSWLGANHPGADWRDAGLQSQFAAWNLKTNYPATWQKMANASTPEQAASIYASEYLKPALPYLRSRIQSINTRGVPPLAAYGAQGGGRPQAGAPGDFPSGIDRREAPSGNQAQDMLGGAHIQALLQHAHALDTAEFVDQERFQREQDKAEKLRVESVKDEYHKDIFGGQPTKTLTQAESDPRLDGYPEAREWIRAAFERAGRGDPIHTTSQKTSNEFERRMDLSWGDPDKLTDIAEIRKAHYGDPATGGAPTLSNADAEHLEKRFNDMRTGDGNTWNQNLGEVMKAITPKVEKLPIPLGLVDTDAPERMYKVRRKIEDLRQQYIKANRDPSDLLNPNKPDYVGRQEFIQPFAADRNALIAKLVGNKAEELKDDQPNAPLPEAPAGVDKKGWADIVSRPPLKQDGKPWARSAWAAYFDAFRQGNPTEADKAMFNQRFSTPNHPVDFDEMNGRLGGKPAGSVAGTAPTVPQGSTTAAPASGAPTGTVSGPVAVPAAQPPAYPGQTVKLAGIAGAPNAEPSAAPANEPPDARRQRFEAEAAQEKQRQDAEYQAQRNQRAEALAQIRGSKFAAGREQGRGGRAMGGGAALAEQLHAQELARQETQLVDAIKTARAQQENKSAPASFRQLHADQGDKLESDLAAVRAERAKLSK